MPEQIEYEDEDPAIYEEYAQECTEARRQAGPAAPAVRRQVDGASEPRRVLRTCGG